MKDLRILSEITTRYGNRSVNELEFKTPEEFADYKKKHKMRQARLRCKSSGKDKVVGGDDKSKHQQRKDLKILHFQPLVIDQKKVCRR